MLITIDNNGIGFEVLYNTAINSKYIRDLVATYNDCDTLTIMAPNRDYNDNNGSKIKHYIEFLNGTKYTIKSKKLLKSCFLTSIYFDDDIYFEFVLGQLFDHWSILSTVVYNELNYDLQWLIFLRCPISMLPKSFTDDTGFMEKWTQNNQNTTVIVNRNEKYYTNMTSVNSFGETVSESYHTINGKKVGYSRQTTYYPNSTRLYCVFEYHDQEEKRYRFWYNNDQNCLEIEVVRIDDTQTDSDKLNNLDKLNESGGLDQVNKPNKRVETARYWYNNKQHSLAYEGVYVNGLKDGLWTFWYEDGKIKQQIHHLNGGKVDHSVHYDRKGNIVPA
jgi:antitoxin component YwqK of YwqJK toxin-antitoxin module